MGKCGGKMGGAHAVEGIDLPSSGFGLKWRRS